MTYFLRSIAMGWLCFAWAIVAAQSHDTNNRIDLSINGQTTTLYADKNHPETDFWYVPSELRVARRIEGGRSRLVFSMEVFPNQDDPSKPGEIAVNFLIEPRYSLEAERQIKQRLVEMGRAAVDPLDPVASYEQINLRPLPQRIKSIAFEELFLQVDWHNRRDVERKANLNQAFPVQLRLLHADASILAEALTAKRIHRIGRVSLEDGSFIPITLSLSLHEREMPLSYIFSDSSIVFSNPCEHRIKLKRIRYFAQNFWYTLRPGQSLPAFSDDLKSAPSLRIPVRHYPVTQVEVDWEAEYDHKQALDLYFINHLPEQVTSLYIRQLPHLPIAFKADLIELESIDRMGINQKYRFQLDTSKSISLHAFGGLQTYRYRYLGNTIGQTSPCTTQWFELDESFIGQSETIAVQKDLYNIALLPTAKDWQIQDVHDSVLCIKTESNKHYLIPKYVKLNQTDDQVPKEELRHSSGITTWFSEYYLPISPTALLAARKIAPENTIFEFARLKSVQYSLYTDMRLLETSKTSLINSANTFQIRYTLKGKDAEPVYKSMLKAGNSMLLLQLSWAIGTEEIQTAHLVRF